MDMNSRITDDVTKLYICFCEVAQPESREKEGWIIQKFPDDYNEPGVLASIPKFVYPCEFETTTVQHFSFVLTDIKSKWTFGFCRHDPKTSTALVFLSLLPWQDVFTRMLNTAADLIRACEIQDLNHFLGEIRKRDIPDPGTELKIYLNDKIGSFNCNIPAAHALPKIPENRNLTEYYSAVDTNNMIILFASMLNERRIVIKSRKLHRLSACIQAANTVLYPMSWQHIFIPLLPKQLDDYLLAPMPFLIGVPTPTWDTVKKSDIGDIVLLDADTNVLHTPFQDFEELPNDVVKMLKTQLKNQSAMLDDGFARTFLKALVQLIGGYRDALKFQQGQKITFNSEAFVESRPLNMQAFLRKMLELQIFQQFIEERLDILNAGLGFSDEFEFEAYNYTVKSSSAINDQYNNWVAHMKKTGTAFYKTVKNKTNPAMRLAVKTVKERGKDVKSAYRGMRTKIRKDGHRHDGEVSNSTFHRSRPLTVGGAPVPTTTYKKPRATSVTTASRSNEYVPLSSPSDELVSPQPEEESPAPRLDMDLLGDLQEVLNRQCSLLDSSPPVDRTLKPVRSLDDSIMESNHAVRTPRASHLPFYAQSPTETLLNFPPTNPFAFTIASGPFDPFALKSFTSQTTSVNPFLKANPFGFEGGNQRPVVKSTSLPIVLTASRSQRNGTGDLIQLDPAHNEESLSREDSDDSIKFKTGLTNPLYPYYTINNNAASSSSHNGIIEPPMKPVSDNLSFVHGQQRTRSQQFNKQEMDLLKEYGIDFKASTSKSSKTNNDPFDLPFESSSKPNAPNNWATFD